MARFQSDSVRLTTTDLFAGAPINIGGITQMAIRTNAQTITDDSGDIYDEAISLVSEIIDADFTCKSIDTILTFIGIAGYCILSDGSHAGAQLFGRILGDCKSPPASTDNLRYTFANGLICRGQLSARRGQDATITVMVKPITDGTNAPMAFASTSITLPTRSSLVKNQFTIGACKVGTVVLSDFDAFQLTYGLALTQITPMAASVWPDSVGVRKVRPVAVWTGYDPRILNDSSGIPLLGKQAAHANTLIQLKKRLGYSSFVPDGTSEHVKMTMSGMALVTDVFTGTGNSEATQGILVAGVHDGTTIPVFETLNTTYNPTP